MGNLGELGELVKKLTEVHSPSGREQEIASVILKELEGHIDGYRIDKLGNLIVWKTGTSDKKVLLDAHMDEIGVVVTNIDDKGFLKIERVGGVSPYTIFEKRLCFGNVIGIVGIEGETAEESQNNIQKMSLEKHVRRTLAQKIEKRLRNCARLVLLERSIVTFTSKGIS